MEQSKKRKADEVEHNNLFVELCEAHKEAEARLKEEALEIYRQSWDDWKKKMKKWNALEISWKSDKKDSKQTKLCFNK